MSDQPQEWTDKQLNELVMDLRIETGYPLNIHKKFFNMLKPWFDAHNSALANERANTKAYEEALCDRARELAAEQKFNSELNKKLNSILELVDPKYHKLAKEIRDGDL